MFAFSLFPAASLVVSATFNMGLTKQYLRYVASAVFGLIGSQKGNIVFVTLRGEKGRYVAVPACEHVFIWDLRKGEKVRTTRLILIYDI